MGMIFQSYNLISTLDVLNNVALPQMFNNKRKKERDERAMQTLERFGVEKQWKKIPTELSGGQQQRIGIARAIVNNPQIILADEPIGNLDTKSANNVMEIIGDLNRKEGKTVILVSHNPENIIWGGHIIYMKDGKIEKEELKGPNQVTKIERKEGKDKSDFDRMLDKLKGLSEEQIGLMINPLKARLLTEAFLIPYEKNQTAVMEKNVEMYLSKKIEDNEALSNLDKDSDHGGANLDFRTAKNFIEEVSTIAKAAEVFNSKNDINEKVLVILEYLGNKLNLSIEDDDTSLKLANSIKNRVSNNMNHGEFKNLLDSSSKKEGVGLDKRVAKKIAKEVDLFLIVNYGASKKETASVKEENLGQKSQNQNPFQKKVDM
jgi:putative ABC transport system ATP-binding protein